MDPRGTPGAVPAMHRWKVWGSLALALALASCLRIWGMTYGLPHPTARPDEELVIGRAFAIFTTGRLDPGNYTYPSLVIYLEALATAAYAKAGQAAGWYSAPGDFLLAVAVSRPGLLYVICRSVSVALGVATVAAAYGLAWAGLRRRDVAALAAFVVATNYLHVRDSRFATVDVAMTFFITASLAFALRAAEDQRLSDYVVAGLLAGLAASAKYNGGVVVLGVVAAAFVARGPDEGWRRPATRLASAGAAMLVAFAATSPYVLLRLPSVLAELQARRRYLYDAPGERALWAHLQETFPVGFGLPLCLVAAWALVRSVRLRRSFDRVLLAFLLPMLASMLAASRAFPRYLVPVVPALAVLGAELALSVLPQTRLAWIASALALAGPGLGSSIAFDRLAARKDTRVLAADWVSAHLPPRSAIAVCTGYAAPEINRDFRRPPAFRVSAVDCQADTAAAESARYLVTVDHPVLGRWSRVPRSLRERLDERGRPLVVLSPFREGSTERAYFYPGDAFYLPFSGLAAVERGGPIVTVWDQAGAVGSPP